MDSEVTQLSEKMLSEIVAIESGIQVSPREEQPVKAPLRISVSDSGRITSASEEQ
jgi:hypothetical protein